MDYVLLGFLSTLFGLIIGWIFGYKIGKNSVDNDGPDAEIVFYRPGIDYYGN